MRNLTVKFCLLSLCLSSSILSVKAASIPTCDDKKVLAWIDDIFFGAYGESLPREKVILQKEFLTESFSLPNERGCEVTLRSKFSPSGLKEMMKNQKFWIEQTGSEKLPSWLKTDFIERDSKFKFNFIIKYDLMTKNWFGNYKKPSAWGGGQIQYYASFQKKLEQEIDSKQKKLQREERMKQEESERSLRLERQKEEREEKAAKDNPVKSYYRNLKENINK